MLSATTNPGNSSSRIGFRAHPVGLLLIAIVISISIALVLSNDSVLFRIPKQWHVDAAKPLGDLFTYLARTFEIGPFRFSEITRGLGWLISQPFLFLGGVLADGFEFFHKDGTKTYIPPLPWLAVVAVSTLIAWRFGGVWLALGTATSLFYFVVFGIWESSMLTLASVGLSVVIGTVAGILLGLLGYKSARANAVLQPIFDVMQTLPVFSYLVPMILFFGFGPIAALMATVIFAMPPMARVTIQALRMVRQNVKDLGQISGCTPVQMTWLVMIPAARERLLLGINQVIMLSLAVVIVASLIGAGGLGGDVLKALRSVRIGDAVVAGFAITFIAIVMDRISYAIATRRPVHGSQDRTFYETHALIINCLAATAGATLLSLLVPALHTWPEDHVVVVGPFLNDAVDNFAATYKSEIDTLRDWFIIHVLKPMKTFMLSIPWLSFVIVIGALGYAVGGRQIALLAMAVFLAILFLGYWDKAMRSLYLVLISVAFASAIGCSLGVWAGVNETAHRVLSTVVDVLQTLPTFVYLIPVIMVFSIGEFPAFVAIVLYALAPAIRYTDVGIRQVPASLIEAAKVSGCSGWQLLAWVKIPLALPAILLGLNQTIMMAFGMLVITALVGTRGLEEITMVSIARVRPGDGLLAGLGIAGMAIVFDRIIRAGSEKLAARLGVASQECT